ncbi:hypothetical protein CHS0354_025376 [Potamilus streckersoni]|uniref:Uncharacterized protein n=1 Tax=Potamilus streckersoni TaxID=2493646 RepID=A0AAE0SP96_9BIVA|nr:hypothetical protein CHS0354_025376 [Potamilus streckersoni]
MDVSIKTDTSASEKPSDPEHEESTETGVNAKGPQEVEKKVVDLKKRKYEKEYHSSYKTTVEKDLRQPYFTKKVFHFVCAVKYIGWRSLNTQNTKSKAKTNTNQATNKHKNATVRIYIKHTYNHWEKAQTNEKEHQS